VSRRLLDPSHVVAHGLETYPGLPAPAIGDHLSRAASRSHYAAGTEFQIGKIEMVANTGTYLDSPFHRFAGAADLAALPEEAEFRFFAVPVKVRGMGTFPVRAFAIVAGGSS
jgi:kynurenine formamidase